MNPYRNYTLLVFSDVNFSPQLLSILQELHIQQNAFRVILIGDPDLTIAQQIKSRKWNLKVIPKRGKIASIVNLFVIGLEVIRNRPNVLFASGQFATGSSMVAGKLLNVQKRIFIRHHSNFHYKYNMRLGILIDRLANKFCTEIVAVSEVVKNILITHERVNPEKIRIIHNGIELERFRNINSRNTEKSDVQQKADKQFNIGVISRLTELKGVKFIAQAFTKLHKEFPNSHLHVIGAFSDSYTEVLKTLLPINPGSYTLQKENSDIPNFFRKLDVFIHVPVGVQDEAFGIVYIEGLASGVECIFTRSGVLNELDDADRYVTIVAPQESEMIYLNLRKICLGISAERQPVPEEWINQFDLNKVAKDYADLIIGKMK